MAQFPSPLSDYQYSSLDILPKRVVSHFGKVITPYYKLCVNKVSELVMVNIVRAFSEFGAS